RVAFAGPSRSLTWLLLVLALAMGIPAYASGQQGAPTAPTPAPAQAGDAEQKPGETLPPVPRDCQVGSTEVVTQTPMPYVLKALRERGRIVILAIGASPVVRRDAAAGGYY